uniref:Uncharacterized protein n=1 Tax=Arundo donax TaxID=35708 RepID=A0A0A9GXG8_ARUDO
MKRKAKVQSTTQSSITYHLCIISTTKEQNCHENMKILMPKSNMAVALVSKVQNVCD